MKHELKIGIKENQGNFMLDINILSIQEMTLIVSNITLVLALFSIGYIQTIW